jgi:glycosyltransferase involved in cell wall biosynthesis
MRVAFDARYINGRGSGIATYSANLLRAMRQADPDLELLLVRRRPSDVPVFDAPVAGVREVTFPFPANSPMTRHGLGPWLASERFDLFHAPFAVLPGRLSRPRVCTVHDVMWLVEPRLISRSALLRWVAGPFHRSSIHAAIAGADLLLTVSEASRRAILSRAPDCGVRLRVTPNGVDRRRLRTLPRGEAFEGLRDLVPPGARIVLTVGDASPHKNHANAVRAFLSAFRDRPDYRMILVRRFSRWDPEFTRLLRVPDAAGRVLLLPHVPDATLGALYHAARIYLHPSRYEGFGIPLLEAMAAGVPVVTSNTSSLPEVAGDAALLTDPDDVEGMASALLRLDRDEALRERLTAAGRRRLDVYTWEACARATLAAYRDLL